MNSTYTQVITLSNGKRREIERWTTTSGEVEWIKDVITGETYSAYKFSDCVKQLEKALFSSVIKMTIQEPSGEIRIVEVVRGTPFTMMAQGYGASRIMDVEIVNK
jgi:hypothetical protein